MTYNTMKDVKPYHLKVNYTDDIREAIVEAAIDDYIKLKAGFVEPEAGCNIPELEQFFLSDYFKEICNLSGEYVMKELNKRAAKCVLKYVVVRGINSKYYIHHYANYMVGERVENVRGYSQLFWARSKAAELNGLDYADWVSCCKRDGATLPKFNKKSA